MTAAAPATEERLDWFVDRALPDYTGALSRLAGDFSGAISFLLSNEALERLGCDGRRFVETAKDIYPGDGDDSGEGGTSAANPIGVRHGCRRLLRHTDELLAILDGAEANLETTLEQQRLVSQALETAAAQMTGEGETMLTAALEQLTETALTGGISEPDALSSKLGELAESVFGRVQRGWAPVFDALPNATMPPVPLLFYGRQIYIETVKTYNHYRLAAVPDSQSERGGLRGMLAGRRGSQGSAPQATGQLLAQVVLDIGQVIGNALAAWQRAALERAQRRGHQNGDMTVSAAEVNQTLELVRRTAAQVHALRRELAQGLSVRHYYLALLRKAAVPAR